MKIKLMKTLMVAPPFAQLIADGVKDIENRSRPCKIRGTVAIYASRSKASWRFEEDYGPRYRIDCVEYGMVIGFCDIIGTFEPSSTRKGRSKWYYPGCYGIQIESAFRLKKPISVQFPNGVINWGKLSGSQLEACLSQIPNAIRKRMNPA